MSDDAPIPMPYEKAVALAAEIASALGGEQARALEVLMRFAARGRRASSTNIRAVGDAAVGALHFVRAREEIEAGLEEVRKTASAIAAAELEASTPSSPPAPHADDPPRRR